jgi:hypothetical protein
MFGLSRAWSPLCECCPERADLHRVSGNGQEVAASFPVSRALYGNRGTAVVGTPSFSALLSQSQTRDPNRQGLGVTTSPAAALPLKRIGVA